MRISPVDVVLMPGCRLRGSARLDVVRIAWTLARMGNAWPSPWACLRVLLFGRTGTFRC